MILTWSILGAIHLFILTYQDIFKKRWVDDRHNYFMIGATMMLLELYNINFWALFGVIITAGLLISYVTKFKVMGAADTKTIGWTFTGFAIISIPVLIKYAILFFSLLTTAFIVAYFLKNQKRIKIINKRQYKIPLYPVFFAAYIYTILMWL